MATPGSDGTAPGAGGSSAGRITSSATAGGQIVIDRPVTRTLSTSDAVPARFVRDPVAIKLGLADDPRQVMVGMLSDGTAVAERIPAVAGNVADGLPGPSTLGLWSTGRFTPLATSGRETSGALAGRWRQFADVGVFGDLIVWTETPSTELEYAEWALRAVSRRGGPVREIGHSPVLSGTGRLPSVVDGNRPVIIGDRVYWATAVPLVNDPNPARGEDWDFVIESKNLSGRGLVEVVAHNAVMPAASGGRLVYGTYDRTRSDIYEIHQKDVVGSGADVVLVRGYRSGTSWITNLAAGGRWVVWTAQSPGLGREGWVSGETTPGDLFVLDTHTGRIDRIVTEEEMGANASIAFVKDGVVWGGGSDNNGGGQYHYSPEKGRIDKLGQNVGLSLVIADPGGESVMWASDKSGNAAVVWMSAKLAI